MNKDINIKYSKKTYRIAYIIGYILITFIAIMSLVLLFCAFPLGIIFCFITLILFKIFKMYKYVYMNYEKIKCEQKEQEIQNCINLNINNKINTNELDTNTNDVVVAKKTVKVKTNSEKYLDKFENIDSYKINENLEENFLKKLKRSSEVEYEKFLKYINTTQQPSNFVVFDLETTGLSASKNEIIEIGAIKFQADNPIEIFHTYVKPVKKITEKITSINGITNEMVAYAPDIEEVLPKFINFIGEEVLIAHNAPFDMKFILENMYKLNYKKIKNKVIDTLTLSRRKIREYDIGNDKDLKLTSYKLEDLNWRFGLNLPSHNAIDDCKVCAYIYIMIKNEYGGICYVDY